MVSKRPVAERERLHVVVAYKDSGMRMSPGPLLERLRRAHRGPGGEAYSEGRRSMHDDKSAQDAKRLLVAISTNHPEARIASPYGMDRPFVPHWADAEQAGLDRVRRDEAMRWLVDKGMLERDEEAEKLLVTGGGFPEYEFGSVFRISDSGRELLEEIRQED